MCSQIFGNLSAALILGEMSQVSYFAIMSVIAFAASISFGFLRNPIKQLENLENKNTIKKLNLDIGTYGGTFNSEEIQVQ